MKVESLGLRVERKCLVFGIFLFSIFPLTASLLFSAAPDLINYQGKLADASGNSVTATRDVAVRIYDDATDSDDLNFEETHSNVSIVNGVFSFQIGGGNITAGSLKEAMADEDGAWLQLTIGGSVMSPRQRLASVPYALAVATGSVSVEELNQTSVDGRYVNVDGDTMTGNLVVEGNAFSVGTSTLVVTGGKVGVGVTDPGAPLDVKSAGVRIRTGALGSRPACDANTQGLIYIVEATAGSTPAKITICVQTSASSPAYQWVLLGRGD